MALLNLRQLPRERVLQVPSLAGAAGLFGLVATCVAGAHPALAARVHDRLARRHARRSPGLGQGLALPHAAVMGLTSVQAVFVRSAAPVNLPTPDGLGVTDALALLVPEPGLAADYDLLMSLTAHLTRASTVAALQRAATAEQIQAIFLAPGWQ